MEGVALRLEQPRPLAVRVEPEEDPASGQAPSPVLEGRLVFREIISSLHLTALPWSSILSIRLLVLHVWIKNVLSITNFRLEMRILATKKIMFGKYLSEKT